MGLIVSFVLSIGDKFHEWFIDPHINVMSPDGGTCMSMSLGSYVADYHLTLTEVYGEVSRLHVLMHQTTAIDLGDRGLAFDINPNHPLVIILGTMGDQIGHNYFMKVEPGKVRIGEGYIKLAVDKAIEYFRKYRLPVNEKESDKEEEEEEDKKEK